MQQCHTCAQCKIPPPDWLGPVGNGTVLGVCGVDALKQCNGIFSSNTVDLLIAGPTGTLTFDVSASNFSIFRPRGLRFHVVDILGVNNDEIDRAVAFTALDYQGTNYKLDGNLTPLSSFSLWADHALSIVELGDLVPGGQDVTVDVSLYSATFVGTLRVMALMYGWARRGQGPTGPNSHGPWGQTPGIPGTPIPGTPVPGPGAQPFPGAVTSTPMPLPPGFPTP